MIEEIPTTKRMLKMLLPTMFPIAISALCFLAAETDVKSSGRDVPRATIVRPMNLSLTPKMAIDGHLIQVDYSQFDKIGEQLTGVSRNINQIAKRINATDTIYAGDMQEIKQKQEEIWQLLKSILSQLP